MLQLELHIRAQLQLHLVVQLFVQTIDNDQAMHQHLVLLFKDTTRLTKRGISGQHSMILAVQLSDQKITAPLSNHARLLDQLLQHTDLDGERHSPYFKVHGISTECRSRGNCCTHKPISKHQLPAGIK